MPLELFVLTGGLYPLRVALYLPGNPLFNSAAPLKLTPCIQKCFTNVPGKPPGTLPALALSPTKYIKQSLATIHYFEDLGDGLETSESGVEKEVRESVKGLV
jgi:hypothetical protein